MVITLATSCVKGSTGLLQGLIASAASQRPKVAGLPEVTSPSSRAVRTSSAADHRVSGTLLSDGGVQARLTPST